MGNASLRDIATIRSVDEGALAGRVVAIDAHNWLYKYLTTTVRFTSSEKYTTSDNQEVANLIGIIQGLPKLLEYDLVPVFVFDGSPTDLKADEIDSRRAQRKETEARLEEAREQADIIEIARLESQTQRLTSVIHETTRELLGYLDIPMVEAPVEGEAQAAYMARHDPAVTYVGSDDYDTLLFGAPLTLRGLTGSGDPELMVFEDTLATLDVTWEQLVDIGILAGTDFNDGLPGVGPKTALREIREHGDLWGVLDARGETIPHAEQIRELFLQPAVDDEYEIDTVISPDLGAARSYVIDDWEIPEESVARGFNRIESAVIQTGLDRFT